MEFVHKRSLSIFLSGILCYSDDWLGEVAQEVQDPGLVNYALILVFYIILYIENRPIFRKTEYFCDFASRRWHYPRFIIAQNPLS